VAAPGGGDELQGIKRGIMELADVIVVNKADGDLLPAAQRAAADLRKAVHLLRPKRPGATVEVLLASSLEGTGVTEAWELVVAGVEELRSSGALDALRGDQAVAWMWDEVREALMSGFRDHDGVRQALGEREAAIRRGEVSPTTAAQDLLARAQEPAAGAGAIDSRR
jgi:LAO/AO transport system kinase